MGDCRAMFCIADHHDGEMPNNHVDCTGHFWYEDTSQYGGEVIAHVISWED